MDAPDYEEVRKLGKVLGTVFAFMCIGGSLGLGSLGRSFFLGLLGCSLGLGSLGCGLLVTDVDDPDPLLYTPIQDCHDVPAGQCEEGVDTFRLEGARQHVQRQKFAHVQDLVRVKMERIHDLNADHSSARALSSAAALGWLPG